MDLFGDMYAEDGGQALIDDVDRIITSVKQIAKR